MLEELASALSEGRRARLVVPTASMAEHLQHELARRGRVVTGDVVVPVAAFVESFTPECTELSFALENLLVEQALEGAAVPEFGVVARYPGFRSKLLETLKEFWSAGAARVPEANLNRVAAEYLKLVEKAGAVTAAQRLKLAGEVAQKQSLGALVFDGFFNFTPAELEFVRAVARRAETFIITLPDSGAEETRAALLGMGLPETQLEARRRAPSTRVLVRAPTPEREVEDVAARILRDRQTSMRPWRDYGLILRSPELYGPIVEVVFERFGIPFRAWRPQPLAGHSSIRFLAGLLKLADGGFDGAEALELLKLAGSRVGLLREMDRYEFVLREALPGRGVEFLLRHAEKFPRVKQQLEQLSQLEQWSSGTLPAGQWAERAVSLARNSFHAPAIEDAVPHETVLEWKALAGALDGYSAAAHDAAEALRLGGKQRASLREYVAMLDAALRLSAVRVRDRRREVVQVLTAYEARQWELPVVFVCGVVEKQFPRHHSQNLFVGDAQRRRLAAQGCRLRTTEDRNREERFLFDLAATRATEQLYVSYPAQDESGAETLRSFFLEDWNGETAEAQPVRVKEAAPQVERRAARVSNDVQPAIVARHEQFSPSGLEQFVQCPFLFFADRTLKLRGRPLAPEERLDELVKGTIIHRTIARWMAGGAGEIGPAFEEAFAEVCAEEGIRLNFRAEAMRMQLLADIQRFAEEERERGLPLGFQAGSPESTFAYVVEPDGEKPFRITGRIDRYDTSGTGAVIVTDYKYSGDQRLLRIVQEHEEGVRLQAPLYLLGLERQAGLKPAAMIFYGLRKSIARRGWYAAGLAPADPELIEKTPEEFRVMLDRAAARTLEIVGRIRSGIVEVAPRDRQYCREYCLYREVCRIDL